MTTKLIIARHGNTFNPGETPRRVGANTDLPLVEKGQQQAQAIGQYLKEHDLVPHVAYASQLLRTKSTAWTAVKECGATTTVLSHEMFDEIDYGPDENKTEEDVLARIGEQAIKDWDEKAKVPLGWKVNPAQIIADWKKFADQLVWNNKDQTILVVTSNGKARFAPHITGNFEGFAAEHNIKISTGALCIFEHDGEKWTVREWNVKP